MSSTSSKPSDLTLSESNATEETKNMEQASEPIKAGTLDEAEKVKEAVSTQDSEAELQAENVGLITFFSNFLYLNLLVSN